MIDGIKHLCGYGETLEHYDVVGNLIESYWGADADIMFLEIGVNAGLMEHTLMARFPKMRFIAIDIVLPKFSPEELTRIRTIEKYSAEAWKDVERNSVDFVYVDGGHSYEECYNDILNYMPLLKKKAIIAGHDYKFDWGVPAAVNKLFGEVNYGENLTWWVAKHDLVIQGSREKAIEWPKETVSLRVN